MREGCERDGYARDRENRFLFEEERPETISSGDPLVTLSVRSCLGDPSYQLDGRQYYVFDRGSTWKEKVYQLGKCMNDLLQLIRLLPLRDTEHSMSMKGYTSEQNMMTVKDGYKTADDGGPLQIRECPADTKNNTSDLFTKHLDGLHTRALAKKLGLRFLDMADCGTNVDIAGGGTNGNDR